MDIAAMSIGMHQASLQNAVSISLMKMSMDNQVQSASQMTNMMSNMAVDTSKGTNIDIKE
jgi:hypothetical protein